MAARGGDTVDVARASRAVRAAGAALLQLEGEVDADPSPFGRRCAEVARLAGILEQAEVAEVALPLCESDAAWMRSYAEQIEAYVRGDEDALSGPDPLPCHHCGAQSVRYALLGGGQIGTCADPVCCHRFALKMYGQSEPIPMRTELPHYLQIVPGGGGR